MLPVRNWQMEEGDRPLLAKHVEFESGREFTVNASDIVHTNVPDPSRPY